MDEETLELPINGILHLHTFDPKDAASVVEEYLEACLERKIYQVRIIHGKGKGVLRRIVESVLRKHPRVEAFGLDSGPSSWGATLVTLRPG